jgi:predicted small integral membrane protein
MFDAQFWTQSLGTWMAWVPATVTFFVFIAICLTTMTIWELKSPGGAPRRGVFAIDTTRGDRLFISLLGSAYIFIAWLIFANPPLWIPLGIALCWWAFVFRYV